MYAKFKKRSYNNKSTKQIYTVLKNCTVMQTYLFHFLDKKSIE